MIKGLKGISRYIVGVRCTRALGAISSLALVGLLLMTIVPIYNVVDDIEAAPVGTGSHLDFTLNNAVASVSVSPNLATTGGKFATSTNDQMISFNISTTNITGYTLKIKSNSSDTTLTNGRSHSFLASLTRSITPAAFASTTSTGEAYNNRWGYSPNYYNSATTTRYYPAPSTSGNTLRATTGANSSPDTYTIGLGIRITSSTSAGTYSYTNNGDTNSNDGNPAMFILEYVANPVSYSVTFVDDVDHGATMPSTIAGSTVNNDLTNCYWDSNHQGCDTAGETITLPSTIPTATGREFIGWCDQATTLDGTSCGGTVYYAGDPFPIDKTANTNTVTLHAVWEVYATVTVRIIGSVSWLRLTNFNYSGGGQVTTDGATVYLKRGISYNLSASLASGYSFVKYETTTGGTLGSATTLSTTYSVTGDTTLVIKTKRPGYLYDEVAVMSKGTQKVEDLAVAISTTNSGVYEYDSGVFGAASDYGNTAKIYYYRGILDSDLDGTSNTYGSNGNGVTWPNYVKIDNTCWRIVRTMGDGGVKMIYNGSYSGGTTANSCANATTNARYGAAAYGKKGTSTNTNWRYNITRVGYTYNAAVDDVTTATAVGTVFGDDNNSNSEASTMKAQLSAFNTAVMTRDWENVIDVNTSYCNDRSVYGSIAASGTLGTIVPYASSSADAYFGAYMRNRNALVDTPMPTLSCPRGSIDIYTSSAASFGNKQNSGGTGLLTADEASFAGSGNGALMPYHVNSFLRSGNTFWTMSPSERATGGTTRMIGVGTSGSLSGLATNSPYGYRPVIGLQPGVSADSGSGTAVDPWVVVP